MEPLFGKFSSEKHGRRALVPFAQSTLTRKKR
jgi:hypothetical protein